MDNLLLEDGSDLLLEDGTVILLENVRTVPGETFDDGDFACLIGEDVRHITYVFIEDGYLPAVTVCSEQDTVGKILNREINA